MERDVKEKAIELFTKEERLNLTEEKDELESQLKELRWEEKVSTLRSFVLPLR